MMILSCCSEQGLSICVINTSVVKNVKPYMKHHMVIYIWL